MALNVYEGKGDSPHLIDGTNLNSYRERVTLHVYPKGVALNTYVFKHLWILTLMKGRVTSHTQQMG